MANNSKNQLDESFVGKSAADLGQLIAEQIKPIYQMIGVIVPVKSCSIIHALAGVDKATLTELAKQLQQSHQLIKQKIPKLLDLELIVVKQDDADKRRMLYSLTTLGKQQAQLLRDHSMQAVYNNLSEEINADIYQVLNQALTSLKAKDLFSRFQECGNDQGRKSDPA